MNQQKLEEKGVEIFVKKAPFQLPENARKTIVEWSPWISLVFGILGLLAARALWVTAHRVDQLVNYFSTYAPAYVAPGSHMGVTVWLSLISLVISSALLVISFPGLKARSKSRGWNLALYGVVFDFIYGIVYAFAYQGSGVDRVIGSLISAVIGLYVLFQVRSHYADAKATKKS